MNQKSILEWLQEWYQNECNGDWEHSFGITIETSDNPGWIIKIDLQETNYANIVFSSKIVNNSESEYHGFKFENSLFKAWGDSNKLELLLTQFKEVIEKHDAQDSQNLDN